MKTPHAHTTLFCIRWIGFLAGMLLVTLSLQANPISPPEKPVTTERALLVGTAILLEAVCVWLVLRQSRKPRLFIVWVLGMHVLTFPAFLALLSFLHDARPAFAVVFSEGLVVIVEGVFIYLISRFVPLPKSDLPAPSVVKCWLASLIGNACSAVAFPVLLAAYDRFA